MPNFNYVTFSLPTAKTLALNCEVKRLAVFPFWFVFIEGLVKVRDLSHKQTKTLLDLLLTKAAVGDVSPIRAARHAA